MHCQRELQELIQKMLGMKVIRPSNSDWAFPIVLVDKRGGALRLCVDCRRLKCHKERLVSLAAHQPNSRLPWPEPVASLHLVWYRGIDRLHYARTTDAKRLLLSFGVYTNSRR